MMLAHHSTLARRSPDARLRDEVSVFGIGLRPSGSPPIDQSHRPNEHLLTSLSLRLPYCEHRLEEGNQLALRRSDDRVCDLRLLPEDLPVRLLRRLHAVQLRLSRPTMNRREDMSQ